MSIKSYVGRMGSGKTYEVVASVIVPALARGRRVVSNIAGLDLDEIRGLLVEQGVPFEKIGVLVLVNHADVLLPEFWRTDKDQAEGFDSFIQPGDLVALDEIWRFWEGFANRKMPDRVMNFFRMHRHFTHPETGVACDVALITQDVMDISRKVRAVVEETYGMEKLTAIGSTKRYRVDVFQGTRTTRRPLRQLQREYDPRYFPLYSSHSQKKEGDADAVEENIDSRGNILKGALFKIVLPLGALAMAGAVWLVWGFFHPVQKPAAAQLDAKGKPVAAGAAASASQAKTSPDVSSEWRAAGFVLDSSGSSVVLVDGRRVRVVQNPPGLRITLGSVEMILPSGEAVTSWGGHQSSGLLPGAK